MLSLKKSIIFLFSLALLWPGTLFADQIISKVQILGGAEHPDFVFDKESINLLEDRVEFRVKNVGVPYEGKEIDILFSYTDQNESDYVGEFCWSKIETKLKNFQDFVCYTKKPKKAKGFILFIDPNAKVVEESKDNNFFAKGIEFSDELSDLSFDEAASNIGQFRQDIVIRQKGALAEAEDFHVYFAWENDKGEAVGSVFGKRVSRSDDGRFHVYFEEERPKGATHYRVIVDNRLEVDEINEENNTFHKQISEDVSEWLEELVLGEESNEPELPKEKEEKIKKVYYNGSSKFLPDFTIHHSSFRDNRDGELILEELVVKNINEEYKGDLPFMIEVEVSEIKPSGYYSQDEGSAFLIPFQKGSDNLYILPEPFRIKKEDLFYNSGKLKLRIASVQQDTNSEKNYNFVDAMGSNNSLVFSTDADFVPEFFWFEDTPSFRKRVVLEFNNDTKIFYKKLPLFITFLDESGNRLFDESGKSFDVRLFTNDVVPGRNFVENYVVLPEKFSFVGIHLNPWNDKDKQEEKQIRNNNVIMPFYGFGKNAVRLLSQEKKDSCDAGILPNQLLYTVDIWMEKFYASLLFNEEKKLEFLRKKECEREAEIAKLFEVGDLDDISVPLQNYFATYSKRVDIVYALYESGDARWRKLSNQILADDILYFEFLESLEDEGDFKLKDFLLDKETFLIQRAKIERFLEG